MFNDQCMTYSETSFAQHSLFRVSNRQTVKNNSGYIKIGYVLAPLRFIAAIERGRTTNGEIGRVADYEKNNVLILLFSSEKLYFGYDYAIYDVILQEPV